MKEQKDWLTEPIRLETGHTLTVRADEGVVVFDQHDPDKKVSRRFPYMQSEVVYIGSGDLAQGVARIAQEFPYLSDHGRPFNTDLIDAVPDGIKNIV